MKIKRIISLLLVLFVLTLTACSDSQPAISENTEPTETVQTKYTDTPSSVQKNETVYVNLKNDGKVSSVNVTDWLHTDKGKVVVSDISNLQNIKDIKGNNIPEKNGSSLNWHMDSTDLYYKGTSEDTLPVEFDIRYYLDGKEITAENIKGKSGDIKIEVKCKNTCFKTDENGNTIYLPVITAGLLILPENTFSGISVENGLCVGDGAKQIIVGLSFPGMAQSLGLDETKTLGNIEISDSFTISALADNFSLGNIYFAVIPVCSLSAETLIPGTEKEAAALLQNMEGIMSVLSELDIETLSNAFNDNPDSIKNLTDSFSKALNVYSSNKKLLDVLGKYLTDENIETISNLSKTLNDPKTAEALELLKNPLVKSFFSDLPELLESADKMSSLMSQLQNDMKDPEVKKAMDNLPKTLETLSEMQKTLNDNKALIDTLSSFANVDLTEIANILSSETSVISELSANSDVLMPKIKSWIAFGNEYGLFSGHAEGTDTSLMFIYMTPSI
ncbi:MAG: hypothetical protein IKV88_06070 [Clostridia bacterium]|nr:hypothetical protein [Clostridia bacterium]